MSEKNMWQIEDEQYEKGVRTKNGSANEYNDENGSCYCSCNQVLHV